MYAILLAHIGGIPVEELLVPLAGGGVGSAMLMIASTLYLGIGGWKWKR